MRGYLVLACLLIFAGALQAAGELQDPIRLTSGPITGSLAEGVHSYKGIPYAAPPTGERRWTTPVPPEKWAEPRAMLRFGPGCPQSPYPAGLEKLGTPKEQSEDCLTLNVWTAAAEVAEKRPVMVWIHGGGFRNGAGSLSTYDGTAFARAGVVVVTLNYRLGLLGFFSHPALTAESASKSSGNYGLLDQIAALQWVHDNIASFGGDPANVTVFGESAGAVSVYALMTSPKAAGLFQRAIAESGSAPRRVHDLKSAEAKGVALAKTLGVAEGPTALADLRKIPVAKLLTAGAPVSSLPGAGTFDFLCVDGAVLTASPADVFAEGKELAIPLLAGTNANEATLFTQGLGLDRVASLPLYRLTMRGLFRDQTDAAMALYPATDGPSAQAAFEELLTDMFVAGTRTAVRAHAAAGRLAYLYQFTRGSKFAKSMGSFHGIEIPYVFGTLLTPDPDDRNLSRQVMGYWVNFARTGNPNPLSPSPATGPTASGPNLPAWPAYNAADDKHQELGVPIKTGQALRKETCDFLDKAMPKGT